MCPCCLSCTKKTEKELPENELWQLYRAAYEQYQSEIKNGEKAYSRYVNDFVSYHLPCVCMNEEATRLHLMRVFALKELLEDRTDLVEAFFTKTSFTQEDFLLMDDLFNKGMKIVEPEPVFLAHFNDEQISLIREFAKSATLFQPEASKEDIKNLFECKLSHPLQATVNRNVALFFGKLREKGLIPHAWQMIIEENKLISSSSDNQPLRASQLRCGLAQARNANLGKKPNTDKPDDELGFYDTCNSFVKKLKESL